MVGKLTRVSILLLLLASLPVLVAPVPHTAPSGDLNLDGSVDVTDLQCEILVFQSLTTVNPFAGDQCSVDKDCADVPGPGDRCRSGFTKARRCLPGCLADAVPVGMDAGVLCQDPDEQSPACVGTTQVRSADLDCDGLITNVDVVFLVALVMNALGGPGTADHDGDGQLNFCDLDSDGDEDPDLTDCAVLDEAVSINAPEICNGLDENCNGKVDEFLDDVMCGIGICLHSEPGCTDGVPTQCNPLAGAQDEQCNGLDDDCNGKTDDGAGDFLCADFVGAQHALSFACLAGACATTTCEAGWYDTNGHPEDGCECSETGLGEGNSSCMKAQDMGTLTDVPVTQLFGSSNAPASVGDWYHFSAQDVVEDNSDSFHVSVSFLDNPKDAFVFDLHWNSCEVSHRICSEATVVEWFTDFTVNGPTDVPPDIPGPSVWGGGEADCRADADKLLTPEDYTDDTSDTTHQCADNSAEFYLRVYVAPGKKPTCLPYKIQISNGIK
jgi:hypothetical protein